MILIKHHIQRQRWVVTWNTINGSWMGHYCGDPHRPIEEVTRAMKDLVVA